MTKLEFNMAVGAGLIKVGSFVLINVVVDGKHPRYKVIYVGANGIVVDHPKQKNGMIIQYSWLLGVDNDG